MIEVAYTPKNTPVQYAGSNREYETARSMSDAYRIVKRLIKEGCGNIFIDKYDRDHDLIWNSKCFNYIDGT